MSTDLPKSSNKCLFNCYRKKNTVRCTHAFSKKSLSMCVLQ